MATAQEKIGARGARTRERILEVAERAFAENGFAETRLEDIVSQLGLTRAALVYYFESKHDLYECVLDSLFGGLVARVGHAFKSIRASNKRIEEMVSAWISYAAERPSLVRIYLREVASGGSRLEPVITRHSDKLLGFLSETLREGEQAGLFGSVDPMHLVSTFVGPTFFFIGVLSQRELDAGFDVLDPERFEAHRRDVLANVRRVLRPRQTRGRGTTPSGGG